VQIYTDNNIYTLTVTLFLLVVYFLYIAYEFKAINCRIGSGVKYSSH